MHTFAKLTLAAAVLSILGAAHASAFENYGYKVTKELQSDSVKKGPHKTYGMVGKRWKGGKKVIVSALKYYKGLQIGGRVVNRTTVERNLNFARGKDAVACQRGCRSRRTVPSALRSAGAWDGRG